MSGNITTLAELIDEHRADTIEGTADAVAQSLGLNLRQAHILRPLIAGEVQRLWRGEVRTIERRVSLPSPARGRVGRPVDPVAERNLFLSQPFRLGDGREVTWGEATIAEHVQRINMLVKQRDGLDDTIAKHRRAVEACQAAGVSCLSKLDSVEFLNEVAA